MNLTNRLSKLEGMHLESEIAEIRRYFGSLTEAHLELIIAIEETRRRGESLDTFSAAEIAEYKQAACFMGKFSKVAMAENTRRTLAELLREGKITIEEAKRYEPS